MKRKWVDSMIITVPGRENHDGSETPAASFSCDIETLKNGKKRIVYSEKHEPRS
jgi:hypothetical protein